MMSDERMKTKIAPISEEPKTMYCLVSNGKIGIIKNRYERETNRDRYERETNQSCQYFYLINLQCKDIIAYESEIEKFEKFTNEVYQKRLGIWRTHTDYKISVEKGYAVVYRKVTRKCGMEDMKEFFRIPIDILRSASIDIGAVRKKIEDFERLESSISRNDESVKPYDKEIEKVKDQIESLENEEKLKNKIKALNIELEKLILSNDQSELDKKSRIIDLEKAKKELENLSESDPSILPIPEQINNFSRLDGLKRNLEINKKMLSEKDERISNRVADFEKSKTDYIEGIEKDAQKWKEQIGEYEKEIALIGKTEKKSK